MCYLLLAATRADRAIQGKPNKKFYDPRVWVREGEKTMTTRVKEGLRAFNTGNQV